MSRLILARALALAGLAAALAGCGKTGELERPAPLIGHARTAPGARTEPSDQASRPVNTIDARDSILNPGPSRTIEIPGQSPNPTAPAPQGALPDPYANPR